MINHMDTLEVSNDVVGNNVNYYSLPTLSYTLEQNSPALSHSFKQSSSALSYTTLYNNSISCAFQYNSTKVSIPLQQSPHVALHSPSKLIYVITRPPIRVTL